MPTTTLKRGKQQSHRLYAIFFRRVIIFLRKVYLKITEVHIELYTDCKDLSAEQKVEAVLDKQGIFYEKSEVWIESEKLYEVLYSFEMEV